MKLRWRDLRDRSEGVTLQDSVELPNLVKENRQLISCDSIHVDLHGSEDAANMALFQGDLKTNATFRCSRCLCDFSEGLHVPFNEHFVQVSEDELSAGDGADEEDRIPVVGDTIDLIPHIEQAVNLALPYSPLCRQDCAGLCPECGVNRNEETCSCNTERIDPRLADLAKFFGKDSD